MTVMTRLARALPLAMLLVLPTAAECLADVVVVVNASSGVERLSREEVINIFLGRFRQLPSGLPALPVDLPASQAEKATFYRLLVKRELAEINSYWARLVFSGRTTPPKQAKSEDEMIEFVGSTQGAVGYLERGKLDGRFKVVLELSP
jgi:ABC-type phosphate transport system substrate-binding protein